MSLQINNKQIGYVYRITKRNNVITGCIHTISRNNKSKTRHMYWPTRFLGNAEKKVVKMSNGTKVKLTIARVDDEYIKETSTHMATLVVNDLEVIEGETDKK